MSMQDPCLIDHAGLSLVFGLQWQPVIGEQPARQARRMAQAKRASHLAFSAAPGAAVGWTTLRPGRRRILHAAAQALAQLYPTETVAAVLPVTLRGIWMAAVHEGTVVAQTDRFFLHHDAALTAVVELRKAYPQLRLMDALADPAALSLDLLVQATSPHSRLHDVVRRHRLVWPGLLLAGMAGWIVFGWPSSHPDVQVIQLERERSGHNAAWQQAQSDALQSQAGAVMSAVLRLVRALHHLPLQVAGWQMRDTQCHAVQGAWRCVSRFRRSHPAASSAGYLSAVPADWHNDFPSLDDVSASWHLTWQDDASTRPVVQHQHATVKDLFSALQAAQPAFSRLHIGTPQPLAVPVPRDSEGNEIPRPDAVPVVRQRPWLAEGPLRSVPLLLPYADAMSWQQVVLDLQPNAVPGLRHSRLHVSLKGSLYEMP